MFRLGLADRPPWMLDRATGGGMWFMDDSYPSPEAGGFLYDPTGNGRLDFVGGGDSRTNHLSWWECPPDPTGRWVRRLIYELPAGAECVRPGALAHTMR